MGNKKCVDDSCHAIDLSYFLTMYKLTLRLDTDNGNPEPTAKCNCGGRVDISEQGATASRNTMYALSCVGCELALDITVEKDTDGDWIIKEFDAPAHYRVDAQKKRLQASVHGNGK